MTTRTHSGPAGSFKRMWRSFRRGTPGHRFMEYYRSQHRSKRRGAAGILSILLAMVLLVIGGILMFIPGPGIPFIVVGAMLVAREVRPAAVALDRLEVWGRRRVKRFRAEWKEAPVPLRALMVLGAVLAAGAAGLHAVHLISGA